MKPERKFKLSEHVGYKSWLFIMLAVLVLGFKFAENILLDADDDDISYARLILPANKIADAEPGDVFVYSHEDEKFVRSKFCSLQKFSADAWANRKLTALNIWGVTLNDTLTAMSERLPVGIPDIFKVKRPVKIWAYAERFRTAVNAPMDPVCLQGVLVVTRDPGLTPFMVDSILAVKEATGQEKWVGFVKPLIIDPDSCENCPQPRTVRDIIKASGSTQFKVDKKIVKLE
ncbi:hypothetical protein AAFO92_13575 [Roseovarius sp. CAU 1744]|uniref:hypothetical protein n=1 Tax=Roseovarius sp. CAU 1744 TaxID=3140368 RepID=UPI00325BAC75